jgi:anaerobic magnesium-protoporphyrin IX monomethyl ester cyclase
VKTSIDCLFIGHNGMNFPDYEKNIREMGINSGAYRDLNLNFIQYDNKPFTASEIFNLFYCCDTPAKNPGKPLKLTETFSLAIACLGAYLDRRGFTFDYVNDFREEKEELKEKLLQDNILTIAIVTTLYVSVLPILEIMRFIKEYNRSARIVVGGPFISTQVRTQNPATLDYLFRSIDAHFYVNSSQGEAALVNIVRALKNDLPFNQINNIYYKTGNGYQCTPILREENLLAENMVDWNLFSHRLGEYINVRTAISCPYSCSFCGFPQHAGKYQTAPVEEIEKELNMIEKIGTVKSLHFIDDTFNVPQKRFREILKMMIKNKYSFKWYSHYRCQFADKETIELMKESGCEGVFLGIESGNDTVLRNMRKAVNVDEYFKGVSLLKECGILTYGSFIIGFPGETEDTVKDTLGFIKESGLDFYRAQLWYCEPLTPIWKEREKYELKGESFEWSHSTMNNREASDIIDDIFYSIDIPIWVPQYNFECDALFHLLHRGFSLEKIKAFLNVFNKGIKERLKNPSQKEVSFDVIKQIKNSCQETPVSDTAANTGPGKDKFDRYEAEFDF